MLRESSQRGERVRGDGSVNQHNRASHADTPTLAEMGVSPMQSSRWQALAAMPEEHFGSIKDAAVLSHGDIVNAPGNTFQLICYGKCSRCFRLWLAE